MVPRASKTFFCLFTPAGKKWGSFVPSVSTKTVTSDTACPAAGTQLWINNSRQRSWLGCCWIKGCAKRWESKDSWDIKGTRKSRSHQRHHQYKTSFSNSSAHMTAWTSFPPCDLLKANLGLLTPQPCKKGTHYLRIWDTSAAVFGFNNSSLQPAMKARDSQGKPQAVQRAERRRWRGMMSETATPPQCEAQLI